MFCIHKIKPHNTTTQNKDPRHTDCSCPVVSDGKLDVFQHNKLLTSISVWTTFGELAILYNCTRTASVKGESTVFYTRARENASDVFANSRFLHQHRAETLRVRDGWTLPDCCRVWTWDHSADVQSSIVAIPIFSLNHGSSLLPHQIDQYHVLTC